MKFVTDVGGIKTERPNKTELANNPNSVGKRTGSILPTATHARVTAMGKPLRCRPINPRHTKLDVIVPIPTIDQIRLTVQAPAPNVFKKALRKVK